MKKSPLFKYQIGLGVIGLFLLGISIFVIVQATGSRQDNVTEKKAQEIADKLNNHIDQKQEIPESLEVLNVEDIPDTISYDKESDETYKFCATYKQASGGSASLSPMGLFYSTAFGIPYDSTYCESDYDSDSNASSLYFYGHKKGENCQTIEPYIYSSSYDDYNYDDSYLEDCKYDETKPSDEAYDEYMACFDKQSPSIQEN